jgi:hypothetical protein
MLCCFAHRSSSRRGHPGCCRLAIAPKERRKQVDVVSGACWCMGVAEIGHSVQEYSGLCEAKSL